jgi:endonuclease/exonuclease/phosphatase family metal-dependent hydrolase
MINGVPAIYVYTMMRRMKKLSVCLILLFATGMVYAQTYRIATYNVRYDNKGDSLNAWKDRLPIIVQMVNFYDFDIFGAQEVLNNQREDLSRQLPGYDYIGIGRDDGDKKGEFSPIYFKTDKFKLLQKGTFWLSETTDKPNKGWDAALPRICSWGEFEDRKSGLKFFLFNTHFDHRGVEARKQSAQLILNKIKSIAGSAPVVLTGDFNVDQFNESYTLLNTSGMMKDAFTIAPIKLTPNGTFNSFDITTKTDRRIDHIFLTAAFEVKRYGILTDTYSGKFPSDHFPVMIEVNYTAAKGKR